MPRFRPKPVADRPWQVMLVPPTPGAATRAFGVARWQARLALSALGVGVLCVGGAVAATVVAVRTPDFFTASADAALLRARLTAVEDSLSIARAALAAAGARSADSTTTPSLVTRLKAAVPITLIRPPLLARVRVGATARPEEIAADAGSPSSSAIEGLPVIGAITSGFSTSRRHPLLHIMRPHLGVDISAPRGTRISAPAPGRVSFVGRKFAFGLVVEIEHADGMVTRYAHCRTALVKVGDHVVRGAMIATVGSTGLTTGPHLHYEMLHNGRQVDPLKFHLRQPVDSAAGAGVPAAAPDVAGAPPPHVDSALAPASSAPR